MIGLPQIGAEWREWALAMTRALQRGWSQLDFKRTDARATQDGLLLWDAAQGLPVVSRAGAYVAIGIRVDAPASATASGTAGDWAQDDSFIYICTAADTWKRVAIASW